MNMTRVDELITRLPWAAELLAAREAVQTPAWLVGGCARDLLLGRIPADIDLATPDPEPFARRFAGLVGGHTVPMDPARGTWRVAIAANVFVDICRLRAPDILGDLRGRDFTINAMALPLPGPGAVGGLLDPCGGLDDLSVGTLRMAARHAFADDPVRILRAFRFVSELGLSIEADTLSAAVAERDRLPLAAPERILAEWWKLCGGPHAARAITRMDESDVLATLFPELAETKGVTQNAYHHLDVWEHQLLTATHAARLLRDPGDAWQDLAAAFRPLAEDEHRRARLIFLALIHDIGKPAARSDKAADVHFYGHEVIGAARAAAMARRLRMSREDSEATTTVIRHHLRPLLLLHSRRKGRLSHRAMGSFFTAAGRYALEVMALAIADKAAARGPAAAPDVADRLREVCRELLAFHEARYLPAQRHPLLTGRDLIELGMSPGPAVGELLRRARELQMAGALASRQAALAWAADRLRRR